MRISDWSSDVCSSDLFALAVAFGVGRRDRGGPSIGIVDDDMHWLPAGARGGAARFLKRHEKRMRHEGIGASRASVPISSGYGGCCTNHPGDHQIGSESCRERVWQYV